MSSPLPVIALVGRPNVGKSTLFNRLTGTRDALVADYAGLTRDRQYGYARYDEWRYIVVDTGGLMPDDADPLAVLAEEQARIAIDEADRVLFMLDARSGVLPDDRAIAEYLRRSGKPVIPVVNKIDGVRPGTALEFHELGLGEPVAITAEHGRGVSMLMDSVFESLPPSLPVDEETLAEADDGRIRVAVVGRPNAGKSTLINRLLGEERLLAADQPGTTRDAIEVSFEHGEHQYVLIDTAGVRRRSRVHEVVEKFSIIKTLQAIESAHVVIIMVDAQAEIGEQDARLMGLVAQRGRGMVLAINKWDGLDSDEREQARRRANLKLPFVDFVPAHTVSALRGTGLGSLMVSVNRVHAAVTADLATPELNRVLAQAVARHQPPASVAGRTKLRYAHQGGKNPLQIVIHGNQTSKLGADYKRYLANAFRAAFKLAGVPLLLTFKTGENPYRNKRNTLTPRQVKKRRRMMHHVNR